MAKSVVIVGGGIVGLCSAFYAAREGMDVTVLDAEEETHANCSTGNAGMIVPSHFTPLAAPGMVGYGLRHALRRSSPFGIRWTPRLIRWGLLFMGACNPARCNRAKPILAQMNLLSSEEYTFLESELGDFGLTRKGLLMLCETPHALEEESALAREAPALGMEAHVVSREEAAQLDPGVEMDVAGGVYFPSDGHLSPAALLPLLRQRLRAMGVKLEFSRKVTGVRRRGKRIEAVQVGSIMISPDEVVLASGIWTSALARSLALKIPIVGGKGYSFDLSSPAQMPQFCTILVEGRVAVTPMQTGLRVAGTMELGAEDASIDEARVRGIRASFARCFPKLAEDVQAATPVWAGFRPCSPDGIPFLGRPAAYENLIVAAGHSMMGLSLGPISGKIVADLLLDRPSQVALDLLSVDRFA